MKLSDLSELEGLTAILGGSFDPIHNGHLHIARQVMYWTRVSGILFVPNGNHHFKQDKVQLSYAERYNLVKEAIAGEPHFMLSHADRSGSGYTSHLMQKLSAENPGTRYAFIIGADNLEGLSTWYEFEWLAKHVHFLVLPRPGFRIDLELLSPIKASLLPIELSPISSSLIRDKIAHGESITGLVPAKLEEHMIKLYTIK